MILHVWIVENHNMSRLKTKKSTEPFARKINSKATFPAKTNTV